MKDRPFFWRKGLAAKFALLCAGSAAAQSHCNAYFAFDGNLQDAGGNGYHGTMIGGDGGGAGKVSYGEGRFGQALVLDGSNAMRALMDLHYDSCPQVTITAWVQYTGTSPSGTKYIVSTGGGSGPGIRALGSTMVLNGTANGISRRNGIRPNAGWTFVAGVYDYRNQQYTLYVRNRSETRELGNLRQPEDALWVGAFNDTGSSAMSEMLIDDLRIYGRALSPDEIGAIRTGTQAVGAQSCAFPDVCFEPANPAISAQTLPGSDPNFARAGATLPGSDPNFARAGAVSPDAGGQVPLSGTLSTSGSALEADMPQSVGGIEPAPLDDATMDALNDARADNAIPNLEGSTDSEILNDATMDALNAARADSAILDLTAEPGEVTTASPEEEPFGGLVPRRLSYDTEVLAFSGVTGGTGDYTQRVEFSLDREFPYWIETRENYDKPCTVYIHVRAIVPTLFREAGSRIVEYDVCDEGLPRINPITTLARAIDKPEPEDFTPITAIQVCNNGINNRVKGIRAQVRNIDYPSGDPAISYDTVVFDERSNCVSWQPLVNCPANTFAVGLTLHFRDGDVISPRDFLSGLELMCTDLYWEEWQGDRHSGQWVRVD